jgi:hypothetical protein
MKQGKLRDNQKIVFTWNETHFPIQNFEKILFKTSSEVTSPIISPRKSAAFLRSIAINSPLYFWLMDSMALNKLFFADRRH